MSKATADSIMDLSLAGIRDQATEYHICTGDPATRAAVLTNSLADVTGLAAGNFTGPVNGDVSGRKLTKNQESDIPIDVDGTANTVCIISATELLDKTDVTAQALTSTGTVTANAWDHEIADPT